jgi:hypothetical protein
MATTIKNKLLLNKVCPKITLASQNDFQNLMFDKVKKGG